jgi:outer membrane receptor for ferrienterochelin and colicins
MKIYIFLILLGFLSQINSNENRSIYIGEISPFKIEKEINIEESFKKNIQNKLNKVLIQTLITKLPPDNSDLNNEVKNLNSYYIGGSYTRNRYGSLIFYIQIYDLNAQKIIDAYKSKNIDEKIDIVLDQSEMKTNDNEVIDQDTQKIVLKIKLNQSKKKIQENIDEFFIQSPIFSEKEHSKYITAEQIEIIAEETFNLLKTTQIVTASTTKESLLDVPASTIVITEQDLKNRAYTSIDDILRDLPGMDVIGTQGTDHVNFFQRGYRTPFNSRTLFMIDGIIENDLWAQVATLSRQIPLSNIKRIEIIYGPVSAVYGPNAFQGIINIITKDGSENEGKLVKGKTSFQYGSGNSWSIDGGVTAQLGDFSIAASAKKYEGNDATKNVSNSGYNSRYWIQNPTIWGPILFYGDGGKPYGKYSDPVNDWGAILSVKYKTLKFGTNISDKYEGFGPYYPGDKAQPNTMWGKKSINVYIENQTNINSKWSSYTLGLYRENSLYGNWAEADPINSSLNKMESNVSLTRWFQISKSLLFNQNIEYKYTSNVKFIGGVKAEFKKLTKSYDVPGYWWGSSFSSIDYLNPSVNEGIDKLYPNGYGVVPSTSPVILKSPSPKRKMPDENTIGTWDRGGFILSIIDIGKFRFSPGIRYDQNSIYGHSLNPRITSIYKLNENNALKLLYGEAFNEPAPLQLFGGYSGRTSDLNLKPEKVRTTEFIILNQEKQFLNEASVYYSRYENVIKESAENAGGRKIYGFEYKFRINLPNFSKKSSPIQFHLYYTFTESRSSIYYDHNESKWKEGSTPFGRYEFLFPDISKQIPRSNLSNLTGDIAPHKINIGFNFPYRDLVILNLRANYVSARNFYLRNPLRDEGKTINPYTIFDLGITFPFQDYGFLSFKILNLLNHMYYHPGGEAADAGDNPYIRSLGYNNSIIPQPGRTYMINCTLTF